MRKFFALLALGMVVGSCAPATATSVDTIRLATMRIMTDKFENDASLVDLYLTTDTLTVFCIDQTHFKGLAVVDFEGGKYTVPVVMEFDELGTLWVEWNIDDILKTQRELDPYIQDRDRVQHQKEMKLILRKYNALSYRAWKAGEYAKSDQLKNEAKQAAEAFCKEHLQYCGELP